MNKEQFMQEYSAMFFRPNPHFEYAYRKWLEYFYLTEVFDRKVCSGLNKRTGDAIPINAAELIEINRNAKLQMKKVIDDLKGKNIDNDTCCLARDAASRQSFEDSKQILNQKGWIYFEETDL